MGDDGRGHVATHTQLHCLRDRHGEVRNDFVAAGIATRQTARASSRRCDPPAPPTELSARNSLAMMPSHRIKRPPAYGQRLAAFLASQNGLPMGKTESAADGLVAAAQNHSAVI